MTNFLKNVLIITALVSFTHVYSYGVTGHRIVAEIAERNLTNKAKRNLHKIIGEQKLAYWVNWPDFVKSDTTATYKHTDRWHYVNVNPQPNFKMFKDSLQAQSGTNIYTQIRDLSAQVKNKQTPAKDREIALRFLIHLVGDASQPMHVGRAADLGGNRIRIKFFNENTNLHSLWDSKLIDFQKYSYTEYATLLNVKSKEEVKQIQAGTLEEWLYDSHLQANKVYQNTLADGSYSYDYNYKFAGLMERQLLYGGLRLAKVLNDIL